MDGRHLRDGERVLIDGQLHKISEELVWDYDLHDAAAPWHIHGAGLDATMTPEHPKRAHTNVGILASSTTQVFGTWSGSWTHGGVVVAFDSLAGFAEETHQLW